VNSIAKPLVSVIVPTYERVASVERLLNALNRQSMPAKNYEVIVVVDGSNDGTLELVGRSQVPFSLTTIGQENKGRAAACNRGIKSAQGDLVILLDDDMEPSPQLLEAHWSYHQGHPRLGVLGAVPICLEPSSPPVLQFVGNKFNQHLDKVSHSGSLLSLRDFYSGNFSIERKVINEVGLFDERFTVYGNEDLELFWRLQQAGVRLVFSVEASVTQHYDKTYASLAKDNIDKGKTSILLARLHPEVISDIKLSTYQQESLKWRLFRESLLGLSRIWKSVPQLVIRFVSWMEKRRPALLPTLYRFTLDYFYWLGVRQAGS